MRARRRRLRSPGFRAALARERRDLADRRLHRAHVDAYPGAYDAITRWMADAAIRPDRQTPSGIALGLVLEGGSTPRALELALERVAREPYTAIDNGEPYTAIAFDGRLWDDVRSILARWRDEDRTDA